MHTARKRSAEGTTGPLIGNHATIHRARALQAFGRLAVGWLAGSAGTKADAGTRAGSSARDRLIDLSRSAGAPPEPGAVRNGDYVRAIKVGHVVWGGWRTASSWHGGAWMVRGMPGKAVVGQLPGWPPGRVRRLQCAAATAAVIARAPGRTAAPSTRTVYFIRQDTKDAGFIETDHYGVRFTNRSSHIDLTEVFQRWLTDLQPIADALICRVPITRFQPPLSSAAGPGGPKSAGERRWSSIQSRREGARRTARSPP